MTLDTIATAPLAVAEPGGGLSTLIEWGRAADAVYRIAEKIVGTPFCPSVYRNKPHEATAAILAGWEIGLSPMAALKAFDVIQGQAAPRAITLRAVVQSKGHQIEVVESTGVRCVIRGKRAGAEKWEESVWDLDRARAMDLLGKDNWKKQPQAMLVARATSECARLVAADAILGIPYSAEELEDGAYRVTEVRPGRARIAQDVAAETPPALPAEVAPEPIGPEQINALSGAYKQLGVTVTADKLRLAVVISERALTSATDLTMAEADNLISKLAEIAGDEDPQATIDFLLDRNQGAADDSLPPAAEDPTVNGEMGGVQ